MIVKVDSVENAVIFERDMGVLGTGGCSLCGQPFYRLVKAEKNITVLAVMAMIFTLIGYGSLSDDKVQQVIALNQHLALFAIQLRAVLMMKISDTVKVRTARDDAEGTSQLESKFLANTSHKLRISLNATGGVLKMLTSGVYGPTSQPKCKESAADIHARKKISCSWQTIHLISRRSIRASRP